MGRAHERLVRRDCFAGTGADLLHDRRLDDLRNGERRIELLLDQKIGHGPLWFLASSCLAGLNGCSLDVCLLLRLPASDLISRSKRVTTTTASVTVARAPVLTARLHRHRSPPGKRRPEGEI